jgi:hypothetical protein
MCWRFLRRSQLVRRDLLLGGAVFLLAGYVVLVASLANPYLSFKQLSYAPSLLLLLVLSPLATTTRPPRFRRLAPAAATLALTSTAVVLGYGITQSKSSRDLAGLADSAQRLPPDAQISIRLRDVWDQSWAAYYLRGRRVSVEHATVYLRGAGNPRPGHFYRHGGSSEVLSRDVAGPTPLWQNAGLALYARGAAPAEQTKLGATASAEGLERSSGRARE